MTNRMRITITLTKQEEDALKKLKAREQFVLRPTGEAIRYLIDEGLINMGLMKRDAQDRS